METVRYLVIIERSEEGFGAYVPDLPGCVAAGESKDEVLSLIREAVELHIEAMWEDGEELPAPSSSGEFVEVGAA